MIDLEELARALAMRRYDALASLAANRVSEPVALDTSAPAISTEHGTALTVAVTFDPRSCHFVATTEQDGRVDQVFAGPSLALACSAANQALEDLAPLPSLIRECGSARYRRTHPQYQQEVHFSEALTRLSDVVDA
jgi:hypothetical protein